MSGTGIVLPIGLVCGRFRAYDRVAKPCLGSLPLSLWASGSLRISLNAAAACPWRPYPSTSGLVPIRIKQKVVSNLQPQEWSRVLVKYREPVATRSIAELVMTIAPFTLLWALACWALSISNLLALSLAALNALFLVRLFMIQHDCGHGAFFRSRRLSDWLGRALGVLTLTPYDVWRKTHAIHHASTGNLDRRGTGDIPTLTVREYRARLWPGRAIYRLYRHPLFLFGLAPFYVFFIQNRLPFGLMASGWRYWLSAMGTNAAVAAALVGLYWLGGSRTLLLVFLPTMLIGASIGMWLFYVQHQFRETSWDSEESWKVQDAALEGSSYYVLPEPLRWFSANIGAHHVHHMASRIPYYRLPEVLRDHEPLAQCHRLTLRESFRCARLRLWDEDSRQLVSFAEARALG